MIAPMSGMAQNESTPQDTTLYVNGRKIVIKEQGDKIKVKLYESASGGDTITNAQIFEGVYLNGQSTESRTVLSALPFSKKNNKRNRFEPHAGGFYIGYTRLSNDFLSFNPSNGADLNTSHSWEIAAVICDETGNTRFLRNTVDTCTLLISDSHWFFNIGRLACFHSHNGVCSV